MLSISAIKSAGGAANYYPKEDYARVAAEAEREAEAGGEIQNAAGAVKYYTVSKEGEDGQLTWFGKGAEYLGLEGKVDPKDLEAVLERINPDPTGAPLSPKEAMLRARENGEDGGHYDIHDDAEAPYELDPSESAAAGDKDGPADKDHAQPGSEAEKQTKAAQDRADSPAGEKGDVDLKADTMLSNWVRLSPEERLDRVREFNASIKGPNGEGRQPRHGWDLTLSAPKDVSVLALGADGDKRLIQAHNEAVKETLSYMQENFTTYRERNADGGVDMKLGGNILAAIVQHDLSRAGEKHLHSHAVVANAVRDNDGNWHAIDNSMIFEFKKLAGGIYQTLMRHKAMDLGYNVKDDQELTFGVDGVTAAAKDLHSSRSKQILPLLEEAKKESGAGLTHAQVERAVNTDRPKKVEETKDELEAKWSAGEAGIGFSVGKVVETAFARGKGKDLSNDQSFKFKDLPQFFSDAFKGVQTGNVNDLNQSVILAADKVFSKTTVATPHHVILEAMKINGGKYTHDQILGSQAWANAGFLDAQHRGVINGITTKEAVATETSIINHVNDRKNTVAAVKQEVAESLLSTEHLKALGVKNTLTPGQHEAAVNILSSPHGVIAIQGTAGAGKTTSFNAVQGTFRTLQAVQAATKYSPDKIDIKLVAALSSEDNKATFDRLVEKQGGMVGAAPTHVARRELASRGIVTQTISSLLKQYNDARSTGHGPGRFDTLREKLGGAVLLVDESSMLGNKDMLTLLQMQKDVGIQKLVLSGDKMQIASQMAGAAFQLVQERVQNITSVMTQVVRQKTEDEHGRKLPAGLQIKRAVELFASGKSTAALQSLSSKVHEVGKDPNRSFEATDRAIAVLTHQKWLEAKKEPVILAAHHGLRGMINQLVRQTLVDDGVIKGPEYDTKVLVSKNMHENDRKSARFFEKGDILYFHSNYGKERLFKRDETYTVEKINKDGRDNSLVVRNTVTGEDKKLRLDVLAKAGTKPPFDVYRAQDIKIQEGDKLFFGKQDKKLGLAAKTVYNVTGVGKDSISLQLDDKNAPNSPIINLAKSNPAMKFATYGNALTIDISQAMSAPKVIAAVNTMVQGDFITATRAYIGASRAILDFKWVVNDFKMFVMKVGQNSGLNRIALDHLGGQLDQFVRSNQFHNMHKERAEVREAERIGQEQKGAKDATLATERKHETAKVGVSKTKADGVNNLEPAGDKSNAEAKVKGKPARGYAGQREKDMGEIKPVLVTDDTSKPKTKAPKKTTIYI